MGNSDGIVIIKTLLDTKDFDKGMTKLKTKALTGIKSITRTMFSLTKGILSVVATAGAALSGIFLGGGLLSGIKQVIKENDTLRGNLQYLLAMVQTAIKNIGAKLLPIILKIINAIVNAIYTILVYINYITKAWFGLDLFKGASDQFAQNMKSAEKSSKKIKNNLQQAGFDELNVLQDKDSGTSATSGVGAGTPSFGKIEDVPIPGWVDWLAKNGALVKQIILDIGLAIVALKIGELIESLGILGNLPLWAKVAAIFLILHGAKSIYKGIVDFIENPSWESFLQVIQGIAEVVAGIAILFGAWGVAAAALGVVLVTSIIKNWDKIKETFAKAKQWIIDKFIQPIKDKFNALPGWAKVLIGGIVNTAISMINVLIDSINAFLLPLRGAIAVIGKIMGKDWTLESVSIPHVPYLAKGAIASYPGKGIPTVGGNGRWAEKGQEAYLPLTDSQVMGTLGQEIARNVEINATIPVYVGNRQIAREIKKINAENDFAYNR